MDNNQIKQELKEILDQMNQNTERLWQDNLDTAVDCVILQDFTKGDNESSDPELKESEVKYNGWYEKFQQLYNKL